MNTLKLLWYYIELVSYPLRLAIYAVHRVLVFFSKEGARWIIPLIMLVVGILLRSQIDAHAGVMITNLFDGWGESVFKWRMEIVFALLFLAGFLSLKIVSFVLSPIVGALPAPRSPLRPLRPLFARQFEVITQKAKLAVKAPRSGTFKGKLGRFNKRLPSPVRNVLTNSNVTRPTQQPPVAVLEPDMEIEPRTRSAKPRNEVPLPTTPKRPTRPAQRRDTLAEVPPPRRQRSRSTDPLQAGSEQSTRTAKKKPAGDAQERPRKPSTLPPRSTKVSASNGDRGRLPPRPTGARSPEREP